MNQSASVPQLAVVIPALDEGATIGGVVSSLVALRARVYVVDDGSTDATGAIAECAGATVIRNGRPAGYDGATATGLNRAFDDGADAVVTCDGDGQHRSSDVARVASLVTVGQNDFASGLRDRYNRPVEALIGFVSRVFLGSRDPFCGLKCYGRSVYDRVGTFPKNMHVGTLGLVWVRRFGLRAAFVDIAVQRRADRPRFGRAFRADAHLLGAFGESLWAMVSTGR